MGLVWLMIFYLQLIKATSLAKLEEDVRLNNSGNIQWNIYHVRGRGPGSSLAPDSHVSLSDVLLNDEERAKSIIERVTGKKGTVSPRESGDFQHPNSVTVPLKPGLSIGIDNYYLKLGLGSPPKYYSMIFDTGSSLSWLQCEPCVGYCHPHVDPIFDPSASTTYTSLSCSTSECSALKAATLNDPGCDSDSKCLYLAVYGDLSFSRGYLSRDLLTLAPSQSLPGFVFGCGQENRGLFGRSAGLVGLARDSLSMLAQLSAKYGYAFSYCLPSFGSSAVGFLSVGRISPSSYKFTPMLSDSQKPSLYFLRLVGIIVGGKPLPLTAAQYEFPTLIDSGTVITRLPSSVYSALSQAFASIVSKKYKQAPASSIMDTCFTGSLKSLSPGVPQIRMIFQGGADLTLPAANTLIETGNGTTCLSFASSGSSQMGIMGNRQQQTFSIAYDVSGSKIGFAPGGCH